MIVYIFQAAMLCEHCAQEYMRNTPEPELSEDSDNWPQGPYSSGGGEADTPQHCDYCNAFLENMLTPDGDSYVRDKAKAFETEPDMAWSEIAEAADKGGQPVLAEWIRFYYAEGM